MAIRGFGSLQAALSAVYADFEVRMSFVVQNLPLINPSAGILRYEKQDQGPPLTDHHT